MVKKVRLKVRSNGQAGCVGHIGTKEIAGFQFAKYNHFPLLVQTAHVSVGNAD